jgi:hypothetical protein
MPYTVIVISVGLWEQQKSYITAVRPDYDHSGLAKFGHPQIKSKQIYYHHAKKYKKRSF